MRWSWLTLVLVGPLVPPAVQAQARGGEGTALIAKAHLPKLNSATLEGSVIEVKYAPGGKSAPHRHPCPVFAYVAEGSIRSGLGDGPMETYSVGRGWYETPLIRHRSENASTTEPARLVAFFVCDSQRPLVLPESGGGAAR